MRWGHPPVGRSLVSKINSPPEVLRRPSPSLPCARRSPTKRHVWRESSGSNATPTTLSYPSWPHSRGSCSTADAAGVSHARDLLYAGFGAHDATWPTLMHGASTWRPWPMRSYRLGTAHGVLPRADTSTVIATAALLSAALCGLLLAQNVSLGIALLIALCYGPLVAVNLPAALAVWVTVIFLRHLPVVSVGPNAAGLMVAFAWLATLRQRREALATLVRRHSRLLGAFFLLLVWFALSLAWAEDTSLGLRGLWQWPVVILLFFVVSTTVTRPEHVRWLLLAFLVGAVTSVLIGLAGGGLSSSADAIERATQTEGRLQGGAGDPNFLAAGLVPAAVVAGALIGPVRSVIGRILLVGSLALMAVGLAATQSRGALLAAGMVLIVGLVVFKQQRAFFIAV